MEHSRTVLVVLAMAAVGLVSCVEDGNPAAATADPQTVRPAGAQAAGSGMCAMMASGTCPMGMATPALGTQPQGGGRRAAITIRSAGQPRMVAGAVRLPFAAVGIDARYMQGQALAGQLAVARIEALAAAQDAPFEAVELLMRIAASEAPAPVRRSALFAVSRLHQKAGRMEQAAQVLARMVLLPDDPRPAGPPRWTDARPARQEQLPADIRQATQHLDRRRQELDELARQLAQQREQLDRRQRELEDLARQLREQQETD